LSIAASSFAKIRGPDCELDIFRTPVPFSLALFQTRAGQPCLGRTIQSRPAASTSTNISPSLTDGQGASKGNLRRSDKEGLSSEGAKLGACIAVAAE
jgi:hypothetical protein